ncbi:MAG: alpha/beta hydrolase-fold protein [Paenisporosarcina sp.]
MLEKFTIPIKAFNQDRIIRVYTPTDYENETKHYPVLYMHDGQNVFEDKDAIHGVSLGLKDYLDSYKLEIIVVGIDTNTEGDERKNEYCPWVDGEFSKNFLGEPSYTGGKGDAYVDFIVNELKPYIDSKYRTIESTSIGGVSLGGLISTYAACKYPDIFRNVITISSAFWRNQEEIEELLRNSDLSSIERFYMDSGTTESRDNVRISKGFLESNQRIHTIIKEKVPNSKFLVFEDAEHHYSYFKERVHGIFTYLFP